ncbi:MAG: TonB-dependent receptor [Tidjanibacter sp.]|nr:TonB-dependent receptor [Tidjanibacter sp.]
MKKLLLQFVMLFAAVLCAGNVAAQNATIKGRVVDSEGEPILGASVVYDGTNVGTTTNAKGEYSIKSMKGKTLVFSYFGLKDYSVEIGTQTRLNVTLEADNIKIDDVVVIGYGEVSRKDLTGALSSVSSEELVKSGSSNVFGALQGRVAGINITSQSGEPGSGFNIKVRGNNSINAGTTPLYVIDGNQMDLSSGEVATSGSTGQGTYDPMAFLNPADIESIEVLKDASATAIYGARGANGVVLITTKSGTGSDRTLINFDASFGVSNVPKYIEMLTPQQYIDYRFNRRDYGWDAYGEDLDGDEIPDAPVNANQYDQFDWQKELYRTAITKNYNISASGSVNNKTQVLVSAGHLNQEGLIKNNNFLRYSGRVKLDHQAKKNIKIGASATFGRNISNGAVASGGGALGNSGLIQLIYLERPVRIMSKSDETEYPNGWTSILSMVEDETYRKTIYDRVMGNAYVRWEITPDLLMSANLSGNTSLSSQREFYSRHSRWGQSRNGYAKQTVVNTWGYNGSVTLTYKKKWGEHSFDAMIGGEMSEYYSDRLYIAGYDFADQSTGVFDFSKAKIMENPSVGIGENARLSTFGRVNYNYASKYYLTLNMRADGSSKFAAGYRVGYFPSVSLAWRASEENFIKDNAEWLDNLKVRLSAGATGNDRVSNYVYMSLMGTNYYANQGNETMGMAPTSSANGKLKWETTYQYNAGIDLGLFGSRVNLTADVYYKDTRDMLYSATLSAQSGFTKQWQNLGRVENKGIEVVLNTHNIERKNFSWSTAIAFDLSRNKVLDIGGIEYTSVNIGNGMLANDISRIMVGQPIGVGYGYVFDGNYQLTDFVVTHKELGFVLDDAALESGAVTSGNMDQYKFELKEGVVDIAGMVEKPGDRKYKDLSNDNIVDSANDRTVISDSNPDFTIGLTNNFTIGKFDINIFFEGVYGRDIMNEFKLRSESGQGGATQFSNLRKEAWLGHWTPENGSQTYGRLLNQTNTWVSSYFIEDGSYIRFKTLSVGYTLQNAALKRAGIGSLRFSVAADNLYIWSNYSGMDPDVSSSNSLFTGFDRMSYPKARTITFGVNATF